MNLVRKIKISKLTNIPLTGVDKEIVDFIESVLSDLIPFDYKNNTYYMNSNGKFIFTQSNQLNTLYVRYEGFWDVLDIEYFIPYQDAQYILKHMIRNIVKFKLSMPYMSSNDIYTYIEEVFTEKINNEKVL